MSSHLIATEKAKTHPLWKPIYNLFTEINAPHLIGQKSGNFPPLWRKVYILFTEFSSLYLHCQKNRPFDNRISKNLSPHLYTKNRGFEGVFWKNIFADTTHQRLPLRNTEKNELRWWGVFRKIFRIFWLGQFGSKLMRKFTRSPGPLPIWKGRRDLHPPGGGIGSARA